LIIGNSKSNYLGAPGTFKAKLQPATHAQRKAAGADGDDEADTVGRGGAAALGPTGTKKRGAGGKREKKERCGCPHLSGGDARQVSIYVYVYMYIDLYMYVYIYI